MEQGLDFKTRFSRYQCLFNDNTEDVKMSRIKDIHFKLQSDDDVEDEKILKFNFYTWILYKLLEKDKARDINKKVVESTKSKNITSLIHMALMLSEDGEDMDADDCLNKVDELKQGSEAAEKIREAKGDLAYSYGRIGGAKYIIKAIQLYEDIKDGPNEFVFKFRLGLYHRRATHRNIPTASPSLQSKEEHAQKAAKYLFEVALNCPDECLRARAFSQLAALQSYIGDDELFHGKTTKDLIEEALKCGPNDAKTLTECGRVLRFSELDRTIEILERALGSKRHSRTLQYLGSCYETKAKLLAKEKSKKNWLESQNNGNESQTMDTNQPRSSPRGQVSSRGHNANFIKCPLKVLPLESEEMYVSKAVKCFEESANISFGDNSPALYNLGFILRACGKHREAEKQFNKIINSNQIKTQDRSVYFDCMMTVMCAYEQSGLCLMDCINGNKDLSESEKNKMVQMSEQKLLTAVSLVASFVNIDPEIKPHAHNIWNSFRTLENRFEEDASPPKIKKLIHLLHIACRFDKIPAVIKKLRSLSETEMSDLGVIKAAMESYLALQDYESAFTFLAVSLTTQPENSSELDSLKLKVQLCTAESRLRIDTVSAKFILKPLFDSIVKSQPPEAVEVKDFQDNEYDDTIDVLILWDDTSPASDDLRDKVCLLQKCFSEIFGLEVSVNLERCCSSGLSHMLQLEEMNRSKLLLVLLENHPSSNSFKYILDLIPCLSFEKTDAPRQHVTVGLVDSKAIIHPHLKNYAHTPLQLVLKHLSEVSFYDDSDLSGELVEEQKESLVNDVSSFSKMTLTSSECPVTNWSKDNADIVTSLMTLFCSLIEKKWPLNI